MKIYLIGFMGAGKTTVGRELARLRGVDFVDLDEEIRARAGGLSIPAIFQAEGESGFRRREAQAFTSVAADPKPSVIALGGGAPTVASIHEHLVQAGGVLFLDVPWKELERRLGSGRRGDRPLWKDPHEAQALFERRRPVYASLGKALVVHPGDSPARTAERALALLGEAECAR